MSYLYYKDPDTSNKIFFQLLVSLFIATGLTFLILHFFKKKELSATEMAKLYCDCTKKANSQQRPEIYIKCNAALEEKNELFKLYMDKINADTAVVYNPEKQKEIEEFITKFFATNRQILSRSVIDLNILVDTFCKIVALILLWAVLFTNKNK